MAEIMFEQIHKAERDYPYIDLDAFNMNYVAHFHEEIEVIFVYDGKIHATVNGTTYPLSRGDIFIIMPGEIHGLATTETNRLFIMKFQAGPDMTPLSVNGKLSPGDRYYRVFRDIIDAIAREEREKTDGYRYAVRAEASLLMMDIIRCLKPQAPSPELRREAVRRIRFLDSVNHYIESHPESRLTLDEIAEHTHFSKFYFAHLFKSVTGNTFAEYVNICRVERSKQLLLLEKSVTEIALDCGFRNLRSYNRSFLKYCGITPLQYKKQNR